MSHDARLAKLRGGLVYLLVKWRDADHGGYLSREIDEHAMSLTYRRCAHEIEALLDQSATSDVELPPWCARCSGTGWIEGGTIIKTPCPDCTFGDWDPAPSNDAVPRVAMTTEFGGADDPAWQRGEVGLPEPNERMVTMRCCAFRFSADHRDTDRDGYTCPMCEPSREAHVGHQKASSKLPEGFDRITPEARAELRLFAEWLKLSKANRGSFDDYRRVKGMSHPQATTPEAGMERGR